ncbi:hypothetical protein PDE_02026 [Penicillium oxalicum 114-2]|uniref:Uncharacterized protein n=1 Tax=Penicillium oxalicum (strain 114-2 / CGMCC 5302) TaxID=933388 RepID=S7Z8Z8_PENO1|nr:hypothetical protein PDE_02026 [Penicillium oxalicum 114-2]
MQMLFGIELAPAGTLPFPESDDRVIVPCLRLQLPCVFQHFPSAVVVKTVSGCADTQASMRTLAVRSYFNFPYHIKSSIACQITSDVRAIRPCQTVGGQLVGKQLYKFFPSDLWWFNEVASVSGSQVAQGHSQANEDKARHIGCILREDLEARANANNEALIIAGSLAQQPANDPRTHAEIVLGLESVEQKQEWLREYVAGFLRAALLPLVQYGIGMEAHGQNTLVRSIWSKIHHAIFQNHLGNLVYALGLDRHDGWMIIRDEVTAALNPDIDPRARELYDFILQETMPFKCFLRMRMDEHFNNRDERPLPNALLVGSDKWEKILDDQAQQMLKTWR